MKIVNVVGARPNLMKMAPIISEMHRHPAMEPILVHTGQHYDANMSGVFFEELGIPAPDYDLGIGSGSHTQQTAQVMLALEPLFGDLKPDLVLVVGDVNSTLAASIVAAKTGIRLAHVEAGLRSFDRTMPEEINRILTDSVSDYLFTTEASANANLKREGIADEKIFFVGNVMIDTLLMQRQRALDLDVPSRHQVTAGHYAALTLHRPANVDHRPTLVGILEAIERIQRDLPILFPVHPRTMKQFDRFGLTSWVRTMENLKLLPPLGYLEFLGLIAQAGFVMTDSGGIQEETTILGIPCLTLRENTERPVTISHGTNRLVGTDRDRIISAAISARSETLPASRRPELWDGHAAERIINVIAQIGRQSDAHLG